MCKIKLLNRLGTSESPVDNPVSTLVADDKDRKRRTLLKLHFFV
jgi:hypothetical protein